MSRWEPLMDCIRSGQLSEAQVAEHMDDPDFAEYWRSHSTTKGEGMKIDFGQVLKTLDGTPLKMSEDGAPLTLAEVVQNGLLSNQPTDINATGEMKAKFYRLAIALKPEPLDFPVEDLAVMKQRLVAGFGPIVVGQAWQMLDATEAE